jgi:TolA-binding protein
MNKGLKILVYLVLTLGVVGFGYAFITHLPKSRELPSDEDLTATPTLVETNALATTNAVGTNASAADTNVTMTTTNRAKPAVVAKPSGGHWGTYLGGFLFFVIGLGIFVAYDISHLVVQRGEKLILDGDLAIETHPEYEEAEKVWANGKHLEAIQLMRDFLAKNQHAQYAALRIAEIYEKNLGNYLAAALEYEEILKKKLPDERWGWAAIHLANLYSGKLNKTAQAEELLHRIIDEHPKTGAAKKAREHLGIPEPVEEPPPAPEPAASEPEDSEEEPPPPPEPPPSNLPKGFRPK